MNTPLDADQQRMVEENERQLLDPFAQEKSVELQDWRDEHPKK